MKLIKYKKSQKKSSSQLKIFKFPVKVYVKRKIRMFLNVC